MKLDYLRSCYPVSDFPFWESGKAGVTPALRLVCGKITFDYPSF